jgi:hypothetical protein
MVQRTATASSTLYEADETAWLDATVELVRQGRVGEVDPECLAEYLSDMARRDRREVESRLIVLLAHLLKWLHQPDRRTGNWRVTIIEQRQELEGLVGRGVLRNHAETVLPEAYQKAVERASAETDLPAATFPVLCPYTLDQLLAPEILAEPDTSAGAK